MARVLVADDDPTIRGLVRVVLEKSGHQVSEALSAGMAVRMVEDSDYDLLVLDINLGPVTGWDVLEEMERRGIRGSIRVVALTALKDEGHVLHGWRLGVDDYFTKPFDPYILMASIQDVLDATPEELVARRQKQLDTTNVLHRLAGSVTDLSPEQPAPGA